MHLFVFALLTASSLGALAALAARPDHEIDTDDIPEAPAGAWRYARRGSGRDTVKQAVTIRLDGDVVSWFKRHASGGEGYQAEISRVLRCSVDEAVKRSA